MQKLSASIASLAEVSPDSAHHLVDDIIVQANELFESPDAKSNVLAIIGELHAMLKARDSLVRLVGWDLLDLLVPRLFPSDETHDAIVRFLELICRECVPRELFLTVLGHIQQLALTSDAASWVTTWLGRVSLVRLLGLILRRVPHSGRAGQTRGELISQAWPVLMDWLSDLSAELADREDALLMTKQSSPEPLLASELYTALSASGVMQMQQSYLGALADLALSLAADCVAARDQARQTAHNAVAAGVPVQSPGKQERDMDAERGTLLGFLFALLRQQTFIDTLEQLASSPQAQAESKTTGAGAGAGTSAGAGGHRIGRSLCIAACQLGADVHALCEYFSDRARAQAAAAVVDLDDWDDDTDGPAADLDPDADVDADAGDDSGDDRATVTADSSAPVSVASALPTWSVDGVAALFLHMLMLPMPESSSTTAAAVGAAGAVSAHPEPDISAFTAAMSSMSPASLFVSVARYAGNLMSSRALAAQATGLTLLASLIQRTPVDTLSRQQLQDPDTGLWGMFQLLTSFAVTCPLSVLRTRAQPALGWYMARFDAEARWELVSSGLRECPFPSVTGLLLQQLKTDMLKAWPEHGSGSGSGPAGGASTASEAGSAVIVSPAVVIALGELISRPGDLSERLDAIVAALNLLRFILIKDRDTDFTRVHALAPAFTAQHLAPLREKLMEAVAQTEQLISSPDHGLGAAPAMEPETQSAPFLVTVTGSGALGHGGQSQTACDRDSLLLAHSRLALVGDLLDRVLELAISSTTGAS